MLSSEAWFFYPRQDTTHKGNCEGSFPSTLRWSPFTTPNHTHTFRSAALSCSIMAPLICSGFLFSGRKRGTFMCSMKFCHDGSKMNFEIRFGTLPVWNINQVRTWIIQAIPLDSSSLFQLVLNNKILHIASKAVSSMFISTYDDRHDRILCDFETCGVAERSDLSEIAWGRLLLVAFTGWTFYVSGFSTVWLP